MSQAWMQLISAGSWKDAHPACFGGGSACADQDLMRLLWFAYGLSRLATGCLAAQILNTPTAKREHGRSRIGMIDITLSQILDDQ
jgi:hypothetical protein